MDFKFKEKFIFCSVQMRYIKTFFEKKSQKFFYLWQGLSYCKKRTDRQTNRTIQTYRVKEKETHTRIQRERERERKEKKIRLISWSSFKIPIKSTNKIHDPLRISPNLVKIFPKYVKSNMWLKKTFKLASQMNFSFFHKGHMTSFMVLTKHGIEKAIY